MFIILKNTLRMTFCPHHINITISRIDEIKTLKKAKQIIQMEENEIKDQITILNLKT